MPPPDGMGIAMEQAQLTERLSSLPAKPGVYWMKDAAGRIIYVGKAVNLRNRVRSYFHASAGQTRKVRRLVEHIADFEFIVTRSELEALILECNLIKKHRPHYNVRLKDDKRYPYLKITLQDDFPRIYTVRRMLDDGARYFGPYTYMGSKSVRQTMELLRRLFPYLTCKREITGDDKRPCLYYHIGRCAGPCIGAISRQDYRALINQIILFLEGKRERIVSDLEHDMKEAAEALDFERAATLRDQIAALKIVIRKQIIVSTPISDQDAIAFARANGQACVQVFLVRAGKLVGREYFVLSGTLDKDAREILTAFVKQFYDQAAYVPPLILLQHAVDEASVIEGWLRQKRGTKVTLRTPRRGRGRKLVQMAAENATETLAHLQAQWQADEARQVTALEELQEYLQLEKAPTRIECYDISNIQGKAATGSMVVFVKGVPRKSDYRRFRIKTVAGADDYAMLQEVLRRRFKRVVPDQRDKQAAGDHKTASAKEPWTLLPDLLIVDGGKGQLSAARDVMTEWGVDHIPTIGLAKQREEVFRPGRRKPIMLPRDAQGLYLLQRIRDEAHRFAISYHRRIRKRVGLASQLDEIPGIGPKRRQALLSHFSSVEVIREASVEELSAVKGMNRKVAEQVKEQL